MNRKEIYDTFSQHVSSGKVKFFGNAGIDFIPGRREGLYLWDVNGQKRLIDCHCNGGLYNLGHRHPVVLESLRLALEQLDIGNHHLVSEHRALLARRLSELAPGDLQYTVFGVGGGEAIDLAIKVARGFTRRTKIISAVGGYHGHTGLALAAGDRKWYAPFGPPAPGFVQVPFNDLPALADAIDEDTAAVILETVPATYGILVPREAYLKEVETLCRANDVLFIADEIQAGLGRTGEFWAVEHFGVKPDILVIGKGLSGGVYPISATCFRSELETVFAADPFIHVSTFGGSEVGCHVALAVLEISSDPSFLQHVCDIAAIFEKGFHDLREKHPRLLVRLRQLGLMMGIEMVNEQCGPIFSKAAFEAGLLSVYAANEPRVAQLLPPLTTTTEDALEILQRVDGALTGVGRYLDI
jgi:acetylornithine/succinyldiaminopimelate/putrescine aminotransferase